MASEVSITMVMVRMVPRGLARCCSGQALGVVAALMRISNGAGLRAGASGPVSRRLDRRLPAAPTPPSRLTRRRGSRRVHRHPRAPPFAAHQPLFKVPGTTNELRLAPLQYLVARALMANPSDNPEVATGLHGGSRGCASEAGCPLRHDVPWAGPLGSVLIVQPEQQQLHHRAPTAAKARWAIAQHLMKTSPEGNRPGVLARA